MLLVGGTANAVSGVVGVQQMLLVGGTTNAVSGGPGGTTNAVSGGGTGYRTCCQYLPMRRGETMLNIFKSRSLSFFEN